MISIFKSSPISIKSTFAPQYKAQFADATKLFGDVQTISFFKPSAIQEICKALVPELTDTLNFDFVICKFFSNLELLDQLLNNLILKFL